MQYNVFGSKHRSNVLKEMMKIPSISQVKHLFPDFADFFYFFDIKNVRVGGIIYGLVGRSETHLFFFFGLRCQAKILKKNLCLAFETAILMNCIIKYMLF